MAQADALIVLQESCKIHHISGRIHMIDVHTFGLIFVVFKMVGSTRAGLTQAFTNADASIDLTPYHCVSGSVRTLGVQPATFTANGISFCPRGA